MKKRSFISANEARQMTDTANFAESPYALSIDEVIRKKAAAGEDSIEILVPREQLDQIVELMKQHGFRVVVGFVYPMGRSVTIAW